MVEYYDKAARRQGAKPRDGQKEFSFLSEGERIGPEEGYVRTGRTLRSAVDEKLHGGRRANFRPGRADGASRAGAHMLERTDDGYDGEIYVKLPTPSKEDNSKSNQANNQPPPPAPVKKPETPYVARATEAKNLAQGFQRQQGQQGGSQSQPQPQQQGTRPAPTPQGDPSRSNPVDASGYSTAQMMPDEIMRRMGESAFQAGEQANQGVQDFARLSENRLAAYNASTANMDIRGGDAPKPLSQAELRKLAFDARNDAYDWAGAKSRASEGFLNTFFDGMLAGKSNKPKRKNTA